MNRITVFLSGIIHALRLDCLIPSDDSERLNSVLNWYESGGVLPTPEMIKQAMVRSFGKKFKLHTLVETGTYEGNMVEACRNSFQMIYSIELDQRLFQRAVQRFRNYPHIRIFQGDSSRLLQLVVRKLPNRSLFWLDAHYSGGVTARGKRLTPIREELISIFSSSKFNHVLLIDDARDFNGKEGYPTLSYISRLVKTYRPSWNVYVRDGIIVIHS